MTPRQVAREVGILPALVEEWVEAGLLPKEVTDPDAYEARVRLCWLGVYHGRLSLDSIRRALEQM